MGNVDAFLEKLPFTPDPFQVEAMRVIEGGSSVVVCAPTGSGKTLIAEYAAFRARAVGEKLFYTTPLKALSNQKFLDLCNQFGNENVGLLTGDTSINRDAAIVVMTTEVFRNMLYGFYEDSDLLKGLSCVILDECHFMNDDERGTVWEESIIYCPDGVQMVALSATVANAHELTDWINEVHHNTVLVQSDFRPVPLRFSYYNHSMLMPLYKPGTKQLNPSLRSEVRRPKGPGGRPAAKKLNPNHLITQLQERDMLPAIIFTFSRKGCDGSLFGTQGMDLTNKEEKARIQVEIDRFLSNHPMLANAPHVEFLKRGLASHHAGLLPAMKGLVETLFQQNLIKAVFATETLAAGINMPARTTVITSISKRTNNGHRLLTASEFLQMSGRAGRRGMDTVGYVVTVSTAFEKPNDVAYLAASPPDPLVSQFSPTYGMVLNVLQRHSLEEAEFLISKSFGAFTADQRLGPVKEALAEREAQAAQISAFTCPDGLTHTDFERILKTREMLTQSHKQLRILEQQARRHGRGGDMDAVLAQEKGKIESLNKTWMASPCRTCKIYAKHIKVMDDEHRVAKKIKSLKRQLDDEHNQYWRQFQNRYKLLEKLGYINEHFQPTELGELTARLRTENELYISEIIRRGFFNGLTPSQLAAVVCSVIYDSTRENIYCRLPSSPQVIEVTRGLRKVVKELEHLQHQYRLDAPLRVNPVVAGLVEAWVDGVEWDQITYNTSLDEGDVVRLLRRTADMLRQLARIELVPGELSRTASTALKSLHREPIVDDTDPRLDALKKAQAQEAEAQAEKEKAEAAEKADADAVDVSP